jgi:hypothetical protein
MTNRLTDPAAGLHGVICGSNKLNLLVNIDRNVKPKKISVHIKPMSINNNL